METNEIPRSASAKGSPHLFSEIAVSVEGEGIAGCVAYSMTEGWADAIGEHGRIERHVGEVAVVVRDLEREALELRIAQEQLKIDELTTAVAEHEAELELAQGRLAEYEAQAAAPAADSGSTDSGTDSTGTTDSTNDSESGESD